ncbi:ABC transporter permease [Agromyces humatus]|uniref:Transport permease protein n=1 Tax=Agromyces humatus TaxID=279573 RepID=A0ABN2KL81_9MICO|nr:ABC transporter permease [Agromyces humatus]
MTTVPEASVAGGPPPAVDTGRPGPFGLTASRSAHVLRSLWRARIAFVFTFGMPLAWLILVGIVAGNEVIDPVTDLRVMQFATPTALAMGCLFATLPSIAIGVALDRESLVLKRLRGTPLPSWVYVAAQVVAVALLAAASVAVVLAVAILAYGVTVPGDAVLPLVVTIVVALLSFSAIGIAVASLASSARSTEAITIGAVVVLSFISGVFIIGGELPEWLEQVAWALPLKPFVVSLQELFNPYDDLPWNLGHLALIAAWGVGGAIVAALAFRWEPRAGRRAAARAAAGEGRAAAGAAAGRSGGTSAAAILDRVESGQPTALTRTLGQVGAAVRSTLRRPGDLFFAVAVPLGLVWLLVTLQGGGERDGIPLITSTAAAMCAWGVAVVAFMNTAEWLARSAEQGILKRWRGTPLSTGEIGVGRAVAAVVVAWVIAAAMLLLGAAAFELRTTATGILLSAGVVVLGVAALAACGVLLATAVPDARASGAVALLLLFVIAFFSDVFVVGGPDWMRTVGAFFPLTHLRQGLLEAWRPDGPFIAWAAIGILVAWAAGAMIATWILERSRGASWTAAGRRPKTPRDAA